MAGRKAKVEPLTLITGDDYRWAYGWRETTDAPLSDWPTGLELYYELKNGPNGSWDGGTQWAYTISGQTASINIQSEISNGVTNRTPYRLVLKDTTTTPTTESVLIIGNVERQEPK